MYAEKIKAESAWLVTNIWLQGHAVTAPPHKAVKKTEQHHSLQLEATETRHKQV